MMQQQGASGMNQLGGIFVNGCPLPDFKRKRIIELALSGLRVSDISHHLKVSNGCVSKILTRYYQTGLVQPKAGGGSRPRVSTPQVVAWIAQLKQEQPAAFAWEIRRKLHLEGVCTTDKMPSLSSIRRILRSLQMGLPFPGPFPWQSGLLGLGERSLGGKKPARETPEALPPQGTQQEVLGLPPACNYHQNRSRTVFSKQQLEALEQEFQRGQYPEKATREKLASVTHLPDATIRVWFSNRRARRRRRQETMAALDTRTSGHALTLMVPGARPASAFEEGATGDRWWLLPSGPIPQAPPTVPPVSAAPHDQGWLPGETCLTHAGGQRAGTALHSCSSLWCS